MGPGFCFGPPNPPRPPMSLLVSSQWCAPPPNHPPCKTSFFHLIPSQSLQTVEFNPRPLPRTYWPTGFVRTPPLLQAQKAASHPLICKETDSIEQTNCPLKKLPPVPLWNTNGTWLAGPVPTPPRPHLIGPPPRGADGPSFPCCLLHQVRLGAFLPLFLFARAQKTKFTQLGPPFFRVVPKVFWGPGPSARGVSPNARCCRGSDRPFLSSVNTGVYGASRCFVLTFLPPPVVGPPTLPEDKALNGVRV